MKTLDIKSICYEYSQDRNISKRKIASLLEEREQIPSPGQGSHQKTIRIMLKRLRRQLEGNPFSQMRQFEHQ